MPAVGALSRIAGAARRRVDRARRGPKGAAELDFWRARRRDEGTLTNRYYEPFFTERFGIDPAFYEGARILDVGCGPRGSLEWAGQAAERVGVDPLVDDYRSLGIDEHAMTYVCAPAEKMPFADGHFDVVTSFNSLDHVDDAGAAIREIARVTRAGGTALVTVEVNHEPTVTEPQSFGWDVAEEFARDWVVDEERRLALAGDHDVYGSWARGAPWESGPGLLVLRLTRAGGDRPARD
jgi:SAM-dependent methyltransferase